MTIQLAWRSSVQLPRSTMIAGRATAVIISSSPARKTPVPRTASRTSATRRSMRGSVGEPAGRASGRILVPRSHGETMSGDGLEIERKYLLDGAPSDADLAALGARATRLEQVYLLSTDGWVRRVRRVEAAGSTRHVLTRKRDRSGIVREEIEVDVSPEEYARLAAEADPARRVIRKVRHVIPYGRWTLELDVFSDPPGLVLLEVELEDAADVPDLPPAIAARVVREVSTEPAYANYRLALLADAATGSVPTRRATRGHRSGLTRRPPTHAHADATHSPRRRPRRRRPRRRPPPVGGGTRPAPRPRRGGGGPLRHADRARQAVQAGPGRPGEARPRGIPARPWRRASPTTTP